MSNSRTGPFCEGKEKTGWASGEGVKPSTLAGNFYSILRRQFWGRYKGVLL